MALTPLFLSPWTLSQLLFGFLFRSTGQWYLVPHVATAPTLGLTRPWLALLTASVPSFSPQDPTTAYLPSSEKDKNIHPPMVVMSCCFRDTSSNLSCSRQRGGQSPPLPKPTFPRCSRVQRSLHLDNSLAVKASAEWASSSTPVPQSFLFWVTGQF